MLHLDSSGKLPDITSPLKRKKADSGENAPERKKHKIIELTSYNEITFEKFLSTNMKRLDAHILEIAENVFSADVYECNWHTD